IRETVEVFFIVASNSRLTQHRHKSLAVIRKFEYLLPLIVDHPNVPLRVIGADLNGVRSTATLKEMIPLRPRFNHFTVCIDNDDAIPQLRLLYVCRSTHRAPVASEVPWQLFRKLDFSPIQEKNSVRRLRKNSGLRTPNVPRSRKR